MQSIFSIPTLDTVANEIIETNAAGEQVILTQNLQTKNLSGGVDHPVIVRPATDWVEVPQPLPQSQSPHNSAIAS